MEQQNQSSLFSEFSIDHTAREYIRSIASWAMVIVVTAILGYVVSVIELVITPKPAVSTSEGFDLGMRFTNESNSPFATVFMIVIGLLINFFLYRFSSQAKTGLDGLNQEKLISSFNNLKTYFMAMSIIMIIVFVLLLLVVTYAVITAAG